MVIVAARRTSSEYPAPTFVDTTHRDEQENHLLSPGSSLCSNCISKLGRIRQPSDHLENHESVLCSSPKEVPSGSGLCPLCAKIQYLLQPIIDFRIAEPDAVIVMGYQTGAKDGNIPINIGFCGKDDNGKIDMEVLYDPARFKMVPISTSRDRLSIPGYHVDDDTGSDACLAMAQHWLRTCTATHPTCQRPRVTRGQKAWRPTRLLQFGQEDELVRLVEQPCTGPEIVYATVSHCWGKSYHGPKLTCQKLDLWKSKGLPHDIGTTLLNSIKIAGSLGFNHNWIDSLCIIQDSDKDWQHECSLMSDVYKYSGLNIAASSASDDAGGCFARRDPSKVIPTRLIFDGLGSVSLQANTHNDPAPQPGSNRDTVFLSGAYDFFEDEVRAWHKDVTRSPLNRRGWVLQERILSPRVLNFTHSQLYWECNELQASGSLPSGFPHSSLPNEIGFKGSTPFSLAKIDAEDAYLSDIEVSPHQLKMRALKTWSMSIAAYTSGSATASSTGTTSESLTEPSDKLIAVSATARELQNYLGAEYVAGHWRHELVWQLAWLTPIPNTRSSRYRAPTWSWASMTGSIEYTADHWGSKDIDCATRVSLAKPISVNVQTKSGDPFGQVGSGVLRIEGRLMDIEALQDQSQPTKPSEVGPWQVCHQSKATKFWWHCDEQDFRGASGNLNCLPLILDLQQRTMWFEPYNAEFTALILVPTGETGHNSCPVFRRVGWLGSNDGYTVLLRQEDFQTDPILRSLGKVDFRALPSKRFERILMALLNLRSSERL